MFELDCLGKFFSTVLIIFRHLLFLVHQSSHHEVFGKAFHMKFRSSPFIRLMISLVKLNNCIHLDLLLHSQDVVS